MIKMVVMVIESSLSRLGESPRISPTRKIQDFRALPANPNA